MKNLSILVGSNGSEVSYGDYLIFTGEDYIYRRDFVEIIVLMLSLIVF